MRYSGLGQLKTPASKADKISLSEQGKQLVATSQSASGDTLTSLETTVRATLSRLDALQSFEDSSYFETGSWDSSQTIRANLQAAINNIRVRAGTRQGTVHTQQRDVSVATETVKNIPTEVKNIPTNLKASIMDSAKEAAREISKEAVTSAANAAEDTGNKMVQKYVILGIVAVLGIGGAIFVIRRMRASSKIPAPSKIPASSQTSVAATVARKKKKRTK